MTTTPFFIVNSPSSGTHYFATAGYWFIPNNASSVTYHCDLWSGANATGSNPVETDITLINRDITTSTEVSTLSFSNVNSASYSTTNGHNGTDKFAASAKYSGGSIGSMRFWAVYTGSPVIPSVPTFSPGNGGAGTVVTLTGSNFTGADTVDFNGVAASSFTVVNDTTIHATVPSGATTGPITVGNPSGSNNSATNYIPYDVPAVSSFSPGVGAPGTLVTVTGSGYTGATAVDFNGTAATSFTVVSDTSITATVANSTTAGPIHVTNPAGTGTSATNFVPGVIYFGDASGSGVVHQPIAIWSNPSGSVVKIVAAYGNNTLKRLW